MQQENTAKEPSLASLQVDLVEVVQQPFHLSQITEPGIGDVGVEEQHGSICVYEPKFPIAEH
jgi:hypothetical protein